MRIQELRRWLGCVLFIWVIAIPAFAAGLRVRSASLVGNRERLIVELTNDGPLAVTAWGIDIVVRNHGAEVSHTGYTEDLLNVILNDRLTSMRDGQTAALTAKW